MAPLWIRWKVPDSPFDDPEARFSAGRQGMIIFLVSLGMLFTASLIGYVVMRFSGGDKIPGGLPPLPRLLWLSTAVLLACSATIQWALVSARRGLDRRLCAAMLVTAGLGLGFLAIQTICWLSWSAAIADLWSRSDQGRYALTGFYVLTGIHAAHVIGGLVPLIIITIHSLQGRYSRESHAAVHYVAMYWHFLDAVWLVLFAVLLLST